MKIHTLIIFCSLLCVQVFSQTAKEKFKLAQLAYDAGKSSDALYYLGETENLLCSTNIRIQSIKVLIYYDQENLEKALQELTIYFAIAPSSIRESSGYKNMVELQKELNVKVQNKFSAKLKKVEEEHKNELSSINNSFNVQNEENEYNLIKNTNYPKAIKDFLKKYPNSQHKSSLESRISSLNIALDKKSNPSKYIIKATKDKDQVLIDKLLSYGCNLNVRDTEGKSPLHIVVENSDMINLKRFITAGSDLNSIDNTGRTALSFAVENKNEQIIDFLIKKGADIDKIDNKNEGPIFYAIRSNSVSIIQKFISYGANITAKNTSGVTPLVTAILQNGINIDIISNLLHRKIYVNNLVNSNPPLYYAVKNNNNDISTLLLQYGAKPEIKSNEGYTMLYIALQENNNKLLAILLSYKANPNQESNNSYCPLHYAVWKSQFQAAELLIANNANVNRKGLYGWTPLHFASRESNGQMVSLLLRHNADKKIKDDWGRKPKKIAREYHFKKIKRLL